MGDRGNIVIKQEGNDQVWLYSHWGGSDLPEVLQQALKAAPERWSDPSYFARIVLMKMIPEKNHSQETGWGISCRINDNEHDILVADCTKMQIHIVKETDLVDGRIGILSNHGLSFEEFSNLKTLPVI